MTDLPPEPEQVPKHYCEATGKVKHSSRNKAIAFGKCTSKGRRIRVYLCEECLGWHITMSEKKGKWKHDCRID